MLLLSFFIASQGIESIHRDVVKSFPNLTVGMDVLKQVLTQMLLYYTRFLDLVKVSYPHGAPFAQVGILASMFKLGYGFTF